MDRMRCKVIPASSRTDSIQEGPSREHGSEITKPWVTVVIALLVEHLMVRCFHQQNIPAARQLSKLYQTHKSLGGLLSATGEVASRLRVFNRFDGLLNHGRDGFVASMIEDYEHEPFCAILRRPLAGGETGLSAKGEIEVSLDISVSEGSLGPEVSFEF
ncbi:hypothetical protein HAX54_007482 [Datura stramonium]|uniref:Uncharacterized protein n=1 Tax=Datura stramonium TaxID=4076 RepID=A0ABS8TCS4_DATST|nr:hypothetical protein [Datura stramonium]